MDSIWFSSYFGFLLNIAKIILCRVILVYGLIGMCKVLEGNLDSPHDSASQMMRPSNRNAKRAFCTCEFLANS